MHISGFLRPGIPRRAGAKHLWAQEVGFAAVALLIGLALMPILIFFAGSAILGRYEGASVARIYDAVYGGLGSGSVAAWGVVLGPYVFYLGFLGLKRWWRVGAKVVWRTTQVLSDADAKHP